jgi:hypothetical protein
MASLPSATEAAANWRAGIQANQGKYQRGVERVTESPTSKAASADAQQRYLNGTQSAVNSGKMAARLNSVSLAQWKQETLSKGAPRWQQAAGIVSVQQKVERRLGEVLAYESAGIDTIRAMPTATSADRRSRMNAWFDYMEAFKGRA